MCIKFPQLSLFYSCKQPKLIPVFKAAYGRLTKGIKAVFTQAISMVDFSGRCDFGLLKSRESAVSKIRKIPIQIADDERFLVWKPWNFRSIQFKTTKNVWEASKLGGDKVILKFNFYLSKNF